VIFFEVLSKDRTGFIPYLSVLGGFLLMFGLQYIGECFRFGNVEKRAGLSNLYQLTAT